MGRGGTRPDQKAQRIRRPMPRVLWLKGQKGNNGTGWNPSLPESFAHLKLAPRMLIE